MQYRNERQPPNKALKLDTMTNSNNNTTLHFSSMTSHYWNEEGAWKKELDELTDAMPATGSAKTLNGELVRSINRLYYDYCNNGNMNAAEVTIANQWDDDDEEEEEINWSSYYKKFFDLIGFTAQTIAAELNDAAAKEIRLALETVDYLVLNYGYVSNEFSDENMHAYDVLADFVCWYCLNHNDKQLPDWYEIG